MINLYDIQAAQDRLAAHLPPTPLERVYELGPKVWAKLENVNLTHSFKIRGALNAALNLTLAQRTAGLVAASSGNHAQGLAYAARLVNAPALIVVPRGTPQRKINGIERYGARAVVHTGGYDEAEAEARRIERDERRTFVSPYNDPFVVAGQGTIGMEIVSEMPQVERVLVCVSGGGLIGGIALALKALKPSIEVIGVGTEKAPAMYNLFHGTSLPLHDESLAEALLGGVEQGSITIPLVKDHVDDIVNVSEDAIAEAMRWSVLHGGWVVEGGGAVGIAAIRSGVVKIDERPTVVIVSGGNVDPETLQRVLCSEKAG
jgi:threonine dehydratase